MVDFFNALVTFGTLAGVAIAGYFQITAKMRRDREKQDERIFGRMDQKTDQIIDSLKDEMKVMDGKFNQVDTRINKEEEDIEDVEDDMKAMVSEFKNMCEKLQRHDFVIQDVLPDFKSLRREFDNFKSSVDLHMSISKNHEQSSTVVNNRPNRGSDIGDKSNVSDSGEIQE